ncbi:MAG: DNA primase [Thermoanaerobaculia bacterium]
MPLANVQLTPQFVQAVRDAVDIIEVASQATRLKKSGRNWSGLCPLHKEKSPSFSVDPGRGLFYCFGCGQGGDAIKLHMALTGDDFPAAMEALAKRFGVPLPTPAARSGRGREEERDLETVLEAAAEFFRDRLARDAAASSYLRERRIPPALAERFSLGYAPAGWRDLVQALHPRIAMGDLLAAGLAARPEGGGEPYDRFRHRLMFPIRNASGRLVGFGGRTLGDDRAKYINTAETERFHKGTMLYGLDEARRTIREGGRAVLVEGYFDLLAVVEAGVEGVVASMGTALTPDQAKLLARYGEEVVVAYDGDPAGEAAARRALPLLLAERLAVRRARFAAGHDPDSLRLAEGAPALAATLERADDLVLGEIESAIPAEVHRSPHLRAGAAKAVVALLGPIPDAVLRYSYGKLAADRLGIPAPLLLGRLGVGERSLVAPAPVAAGETTPGVRAEEEALRLLLAAADAGDELPGPEEMPLAEVFLDPVLRKFFETFLVLYSAESARRAPSTRELLARLGDVPEAAARASRLLLEFEGLSGGPARLSVAFAGLRRRWLKERRRAVAAELEQAERRGDAARVGELLVERERLTRELHALGGERAAS